MKSNRPVYRNEWKYVISQAEKEVLKQRMKHVFLMDPNAGDTGYMIRSLYFDDYWNSAYAEKDAGVYGRKKYREMCIRDRSRICSSAW